jgi:hypothetical protein
MHLSAPNAQSRFPDDETLQFVNERIQSSLMRLGSDFQSKIDPKRSVPEQRAIGR